MSKIVSITKEQLNNIIKTAMEKAIAAGALPEAELPNFTIERPNDRTHGDWATNAAMAGARAFRKAPRMIAEAIVAHMELEGTYFDRCEIAGPGFINFFLSPSFNADVLIDVNTLGDDYGHSNYGEGKKVLIEFVSANPTGPMHIGNARGGAIGDCLASVMQAAGYETHREFYVNDAGNQIEKFATSLEVRYLQIYDPSIEMPDDAYHGKDIIAHAENFSKEFGDKYVNAESQERRDALVAFALPKNIQGLEDDLKKYRIVYDKWFKESTLHGDGSVKEVIEKMKASGNTYEKDGALWFKATDFGNEKDIVLVRDNGIPTYIVPDIAYHYNKLVTRGYDKAINILGADHHGYITRLKGALEAFGVDSSKLDIVIMQMVRLVSGGETIKLSKRSGKAITLNTLLEEIPIDAARFFFNLREPNSQFDFDLDLAISESSQNPVYYVQYAHARICSILRTLKEDGIEPKACGLEELSLLTAEEEIDLIHHIAAYTDEIISSAKDYNPARITNYVVTLATLFHKFYNACRVRVEDEKLMQARLYLCTAAATVIKNVLTMFKISVPESM